ncbi:unnamed protein product [Cercopithifilaria johnstoni]|uniref:Uncharacterized protein n=1 Tax=Cercopithifilaria johnstoni TaxID=2874296 RepID=A0A8J2M647_9BILA|nr:unnamed protein product [Cercopithifilaria johnstoni]
MISVIGIDNEQDLFEKAIIRAYAQRSALFEPKAIQPPDPTVVDDTLQEGSQMQDGELTNELSDMTNADDNAQIHARSLSTKIAQISNREQPCLYQWSEWGQCSETCLSSSRLPSRSRHVLKKTIIQARGHFPSCPSNLATMTEHMPCNVYRCPVALSSFTNWTQCFYKDPNIGEAGGCYRMRDLPITNQLIHIDTDNIVIDCNCPDHIV